MSRDTYPPPLRAYLLSDVESGDEDSANPQDYRPADYNPSTRTKLSTTSAVFMLCALSLGVGVFLIPSVFALLGLPLGILLLIIFGSISTFIALQVSVLEGDSMSELTTTPLLKSLANVFIVITLVTGNAGHLQIVSMMLFDLMEWFVTGDYGNYEFMDWQKAILVTIFLAVVMPYCFITDLSVLKYVGTAVSGVVITLCTVVVASCVASIHEDGAQGLPGGKYELPLVPADIATVVRLVPTICFCFTSLFTLFPIKKLFLSDWGEKVGLAKLRSAVIWSGALQTGIYTIIAVVASLTFGTNAGEKEHNQHHGNGNVLFNFPPSNYLVTGLCLALVVVIVLDYPLIQFTAVETVLNALPEADTEATYKAKGKKSLYGRLREYGRQITSLVFALAVIVTVVFVPRLDDLFGLCGSLGIAGFCYVVPGIVLARRSESRRGKIAGGAVAVLGLAILIASSAFIIMHVNDGDE